MATTVTLGLYIVRAENSEEIHSNTDKFQSLQSAQTITYQYTCNQPISYYIHAAVLAS